MCERVCASEYVCVRRRVCASVRERERDEAVCIGMRESLCVSE